MVLQTGIWLEEKFAPDHGVTDIINGWGATETGEKYVITVDRVAAFVRIRLGGFFTVDDVRDFAAAQARAYAALATARGRHITLCDVSECKIQLQEVVEAFRGLLTDKSLMSERMAFVTGVSPAKMQIRRLIARDTCRFFEDVGSAERWLAMIECEDRPASIKDS